MQQTTLDNIESELKELGAQPHIEQLPALKLVENTIAEIEVDFSKPWEKWVDPESKVVKKIVPCTYLGVKSIFWLNTKNPIYRELLEAAKAGKTKFRILRTGTAKATRFTLIKE